MLRASHAPLPVLRLASLGHVKGAEMIIFELPVLGFILQP